MRAARTLFITASTVRFFRSGPSAHRRAHTCHRRFARTQSTMNTLQYAVAAIGGISSVLVAAVYTLQEKLLYLPSIPTRELQQNPNEFGMVYSDVELVTADDVKLHAWLITQPDNRSKSAATFIYLHGNAGNVSGHCRSSASPASSGCSGPPTRR